MSEVKEILPLTSIRGVAALWVVGDHWLAEAPTWAFHPFASGYLAVDVFFVLSGFVLSSAYIDLRSPRIVGFFVKRVMRIYPLHVFALTALLLFVTYPHWHASELAQLISITSLSSYLLMNGPLNISAAANPPAWSSGVEMICYAMFPFLVAFLRYVKMNTLAATAAIILAMLSEIIFQPAIMGGTAGLASIERGFLGFILGASAYAIRNRIRLRDWILSLAEVVTAVGFFYCLTDHRQQFAIPISCCLIILLSLERGPVSWLLSRSPFVWVGTISFSIYLLHYPLMVLADRVGFHHPTMEFNAFRIVRWSIVVTLVMLVLSDFAYRFIETPGRKLGSRLAGLYQSAQGADPAHIQEASVRGPTGAGRAA